jgi:hypothetical protein
MSYDGGGSRTPVERHLLRCADSRFGEDEGELTPAEKLRLQRHPVRHHAQHTTMPAHPNGLLDERAGRLAGC